MNNLSEKDIKNIDAILNHTGGLSTMSMIHLMVELWQWDIKPETPGIGFYHIQPQVKKYFDEGGHSAWLNAKIQSFVFEVVHPWFHKTYEEIFNNLEAQYPEKWSEEYIVGFGEFTALVTDEWLERTEFHTSYLPAKEEAEDVMKLTDFENNSTSSLVV